MRAGQAAAAAGVTVKALRYDEQNELLTPRRLTNGYRDVSYAIFPPDTHAEQVLDGLRTHPTQSPAEPA